MTRKLEPLSNRSRIEQLERELADAIADAKSWADQCSERVKDWDAMRIRAEKAERELAGAQFRETGL